MANLQICVCCIFCFLFFLPTSSALGRRLNPAPKPNCRGRVLQRTPEPISTCSRRMAQSSCWRFYFFGECFCTYRLPQLDLTHNNSKAPGYRRGGRRKKQSHTEFQHAARKTQSFGVKELTQSSRRIQHLTTMQRHSIYPITGWHLI